MFLNRLGENEKELFLSLCAHAASLNGDFDEEEMEKMAHICYEMMLPNHLPDTSQPLVDVLNELAKNTSKQERYIIVFELIMMLLDDGIYFSSEESFARDVAETLGLTEEKFRSLTALADQYVTLRDDILFELSN